MSRNARPKTILIGGGEHGRVLLGTLQELSWTVHGVADPGLKNDQPAPDNLPLIEEATLQNLHPPETTQLINGIGMLPGSQARQSVFMTLQALGYSFPAIIHPTAIISPRARYGDGVQIMAGAIIQNDSVIGANSLINTGAQIDHDAQIGAHVHIAPGAVICGSVSIGDGTFIGAGATIINGLSIGSNAVIGAGSVITRNVPDGARIIGRQE